MSASPLVINHDKIDIKPKGFTGQKHPEVYKNYPRSNPIKPGQLSEEQIKKFHEDGYVLIKDFFTKQEIQAAKDEVYRLVDELALKLYKANKITNLHKEKDFYGRLIAIENEFPGSSIILHKTGVLTKPFQNIASNERMLNLLEDFLGSNITFNPVWNLRTKTPNNDASVVPWHQDAGYFSEDSYTMLIMSAWIPLIHATAKNGTMQMVKRAHKDALVGLHECCAGPTWYLMLEEKEIESRFNVSIENDSEIIDVPEGSFILFNQFTPHRSLPNTSNIVRWALDFRWHMTGNPSCLYGLKEGCEVRLGEDPNFEPPWDNFNAVDRNTAQIESTGVYKNDEFSTIIMGPWMGQWNMVHTNHHTAAFINDSSHWNPRMVHG